MNAVKKKLALLGGGGHCRSVLDCVLSAGDYDEIGVVERDGCQARDSVLGADVIGVDSDLSALYAQGWTFAFVTLGSVGNSAGRRRLYRRAIELGFTVPVIADSSAVLGRGVRLSEGAFVGKRAVVNCGAFVGDCAIVNTGAILEHDCVIGAFAHIAPGAVLCGNVSVGEGAHVGAGSAVRQGVRIGAGSLIGAGSVVVRDIPDGVKAFGNPCRVIPSP